MTEPPVLACVRCSCGAPAVHDPSQIFALGGHEDTCVRTASDARWCATVGDVRGRRPHGLPRRARFRGDTAASRVAKVRSVYVSLCDPAFWGLDAPDE